MLFGEAQLLLRADHARRFHAADLGRLEQRELARTPVDQLRASLHRVALLVGEQARGEQLLSEFGRQLALLAPPATQPPASWPSALIYAGKGFTAGVQSLENDLLTAVGLRNQAAQFGLNYSGYVNLETLLSQPPEVLVVSRYHPYSASLATQFLRLF